MSCGTKEKRLPYIGHHDIARVASDHYDMGDTIYHTIPSFEYLTQDSTLLNAEDIKGKVWIAKFFFTTCPTICPPMTSAMKEVHEGLSDEIENLVFLSFTIDPEKDTPSKLAEYVSVHGITSKNWYFLTGEESETHDLGVNGFYVHAMSDDLAPGGFAHSPNFVLVDQHGHIRGLYDGLMEEDRAQLVEDVRFLIKN